MLKPTLRVKCNYCGLLSTKAYVVRNELTIVKCAGCGLLYTNPQLATRDLVKLYGQDYFQSKTPLIVGYENYFQERENLEKEADYYLEIISQFITLKKTKLLEVGCAFGFFLNRARKEGFGVRGVEISEFAAQTARKNFKLKVTTGEFSRIKLASDFDLVLMWTVLEHTKDPLAYLKKAFRVLKPGGFLFLSVPDAGNFLAKITGKKWPGFQKVQEHNYFFTFTTLSQLLTKAGFKVVSKRRGAFFCNLGFVANKLAAYNQSLSRGITRFLKMTHLSKFSFNFSLMDMLVVAGKK